jgi:hypothetical protein
MQKNYVLYYKDVLDILTHPLVEPYAQTSTLVNLINKNNYTFITHHKLMELNPIPLIYFCCYSKMGKGLACCLRDRLQVIAYY